jgi:hypothetical protein
VWFSKTGATAAVSAAGAEPLPVHLSDLLTAPSLDLFAGDGSQVATAAVTTKGTAAATAWPLAGSGEAVDDLHQGRWLLI